MRFIYDWTYPNLGRYYRNKPPFRGSLISRAEDAFLFGLNRIEVPFDLARKENGESKYLGLNVGAIIPDEKFRDIIEVSSIPRTIGVSIHTDPQLKENHTLFWNNRDWRNQYVAAIAKFCKWIQEESKNTFNIEFVELHPGTEGTSDIFALKSAVIELIDTLEKQRILPLVVIENRTSDRRRSVMGTVEAMLKLAEEILNEDEKFIAFFGYAVDIQQLFTEYRKDPTKVLGGLQVLIDYDPRLLKVFHIHTKHRAIKPTDPIPWKIIAKTVRNLYDLGVKPKLLPEVHKSNDIIKTIILFEKFALS